MPTVHRASTREEKAAKTENSGDVLEFLKSAANQRMCVRKLPRTAWNWRESPPKVLLFPLVRVETSL